MANPFEKRATEYIRDDAAFLSIISPEPLITFFAKAASDGALFDRLVWVVGTPGSGKTTIATLVEYRMVEAILADPDKDDYRPLADALRVCGFVEGGQPNKAAVRLPMEAEYRDFWELPYEEGLKTKLVSALIQARALLGLARNLTASRRRTVSEIEFVARSDSEAALHEIGGSRTEDVLEKARRVERAVYEVGARLVPPAVEEIGRDAINPFRPFDVIEAVRIQDVEGKPLLLKPLVILDDAHTLQPEQFRLLARDLARREIGFARWIMMRLDALTPADALLEGGVGEGPEVKSGRDYYEISLQKGIGREAQRRAFRKMARDMADRYLRLMPLFAARQYRRFDALLSTEPDLLPAQSIGKLGKSVDAVQRRLGVSPNRRKSIEREVKSYIAAASSSDIGEDVQLGMIRVLMHRYGVRVPQESLFREREDPEPRRKLVADSGVADAARVQLHHEFERALHYGLLCISDASSDNAELFLQLAGALVNRMETRLIRGDPPTLSARQQDRELQKRATQMIREWDFPFAARIRKLVEAVADACLAESLRGNAPLDAGANAIGIPQDEFERIPAEFADFARMLQYAVAYNALTLTQNYGQGGKRWCLIELGGPVLLARGLTVKRGGFLEFHAAELAKLADF
jgi:hypothetical protein